MGQPKKFNLETLGLRLDRDAIRKIKTVALELDITAAELAMQAFTLWWSHHRKAEKFGVLFPLPAPRGTPKGSSLEGEPRTP